MAVFLLLGTGLGLCFHYVIAGHYAGAAWPLSGFGERPDLVVNDYVLPLGISSELAPFDNIRAYRPFEPVPYGPFGLLVYAGLAQLPMAWATVLYLGGFLLLFFFLVDQSLDGLERPERFLIAIPLVFCSYPVLFLLDRGNADGWVFALIYLGLVGYQWRNWRTLSAILLAIAAAVKLYPALFMVVFFVRRDFRTFFQAAALLVGLSSLSFLAFESPVTHQLQTFLGEISKAAEYCFESPDACLNSSLVVPYKQFLTTLLGPDWYGRNQQQIGLWYSLLSLALIAAAVLFLFRKHPPLLLEVTLLTILVIWIPVLSWDYKLTLMYVPLLIAFRSKETRNLFLPILMISLLLIPKKIFGYEGAKTIDQLVVAALFLWTVISIFKWERPQEEGTMVVQKLPWVALASMVTILMLTYGSKTHALMGLREFHGEGETIDFIPGEPEGHFGQGWFAFESDGTNTYRWMGAPVAHLYVRLKAGLNYRLELDLRNHVQNPDQQVRVWLDSVELGAFDMERGERRVETVRLPASLLSPGAFRYKVSVSVDVLNQPGRGDPRRLGVALNSITFHGEEALPLFDGRGDAITFSLSDETFHYGMGWHPFETDGDETWRWMSSRRAVLYARLKPGSRYNVSVEAANHGRNPDQQVRVLMDAREIGEFGLGPGEKREETLSVPDTLTGAGRDSKHKLVISVSALSPPGGADSRNLGVALYSVRFLERQ